MGRWSCPKAIDQGGQNSISVRPWPGIVRQPQRPVLRLPKSMEGNRSGNRSSNRSSNRSGNRSSNRSDNRSSNRSGNRSGNRSSNRSGNRSDNRSDNRSSKRSSNRSDNRSGNRSSNRKQQQKIVEPRKLWYNGRVRAKEDECRIRLGQSRQERRQRALT